MEETAGRALAGGAQTKGLVRVGNTTRRPPHHRSAYVDALLHHLADVGFVGAPRSLGYDDRGRQVLTFVEGEVPYAVPYRLSDARIRSATALIKAFHDATATCALRADQEVVCHGDLGPHNTVFRGEEAVALIDFDADVGPGRRLDDFAHAVWCFADLTEADVAMAEQARRTRLMCDAYPAMTPAAVVEALTARFHRARAQHLASGRHGGVRVFDDLLHWMARSGGRIAAS
jgi:tRNA A-37 threonylcarbamoyl transferase component Bud32